MVNHPPTLEAETLAVSPVAASPAEPATLAAPIPGRRLGSGNLRKFTLAADTVKKGLAPLPEEQRKDAWWLFEYLLDRDVPNAELGNVLRKPDGQRYSGDSIKQLLLGGRARRGENVDPIIDAIRDLRKIDELRRGQVVSGFIRTRLHVEIEKRILRALARQRLTFIIGESQIGKSESFKQFKLEHNHGQTVLVEMPSRGGLTAFLKALADAVGIPASLDTTHLTKRLIDAFDSQMILLVDEGHRGFTNSGKATDVWDFLRELYNKAHCAICIALTNEGFDWFTQGPSAQKLKQLWKRRITPLRLPAMPPEDDAALFAQAYGLVPAVDEPLTVEVQYRDDRGRLKSRQHTESPLKLQREVLGTEGLGVWITILQDASDMAAAQGRAITWGAVIKAHSQSLADGEMLE